MKRSSMSGLGGEFAGHGTVNHSIDRHVRSGGFHHANTVEGFFALLKRAVYASQPGNWLSQNRQNFPVMTRIRE